MFPLWNLRSHQLECENYPSGMTPLHVKNLFSINREALSSKDKIKNPLKKTLRIINIAPMIDNRKSIRITTITHDHIFFECDVGDRAFWYPILHNHWKTNKRMNLKMLDKATAYSSHNLHLIAKRG